MAAGFDASSTSGLWRFHPVSPTSTPFHAFHAHFISSQDAGLPLQPQAPALHVPEPPLCPQPALAVCHPRLDPCTPTPTPFWERLCVERAGARVGGTPTGRSSTCQWRDDCPALARSNALCPSCWGWPSRLPTSHRVLNPPPSLPTQRVDDQPPPRPIHEWRIPSSKGAHVRTPGTADRHTLSALMAPPSCPPPCGPDTEQCNRDSPGAPLAQPPEAKEGGVGR